jgi:hypothetical protein
MRKGLVLILIVVGGLASAAPRTVSSSQALAEICDGPHTLPLEVAGSRHFVMVTLAGPKATETIRFHVDTGGNTPGLVLRRSAARRLGFDSEGQLPSALRVGREDVKVPTGARWAIVDDSDFEAQTRKAYSEGQIGAGFLSRFVVCIDPSRGRLGLADPSKLTVAPDGQALPLILEVDGRYPFAFARVGKAGFGVLIDTGATTSMLETSVMDGRMREHPDWPAVAGAAGDADMHAAVREIRMLRASDVEVTFPTAALDKIKLSRAPIVKLSSVLFEEQPDGSFESIFGNVRYTGGAHGAIANDVLNRYRLLFDYNGARLWLVPTRRPPDRSASMVRVGLALRFEADGCPRIARVSDGNSPDTRVALRVGDVLLAVDGHDACKAWHHEISEWLAGELGTWKEIKVKRDRETVTVRVPVADLLPLAVPR